MEEMINNFIANVWYLANCTSDHCMSRNDILDYLQDQLDRLEKDFGEEKFNEILSEKGIQRKRTA